MDNELNKTFKSYIARRLLIAVVLMSSAITVVTTGWQLYGDYKIGISEIEKNFSIIKKNHIKPLANSLKGTDSTQISSQLELILTLRDMEHLTVITPDKNPWSVGVNSSGNTLKKSFSISYLDHENNQKTGQLHAIATLDNLYNRLKDKVFTILISNGVKTFIVSGFILFLFNLMVTRHLKKLAQHVTSIDLKKTMPPLSWDKKDKSKQHHDELDHVAYAINRMQDNLKQSVVKLRDSEKYNRTLFEQSPIGLALCTMDGKLIYNNQAYADIIGRTVEETNQLTYWEITPKKYYKDEEKQLESLKKTLSYGPYEKEYIHKKGHLVPVRLSGTILRQNEEDYIWSSVEDISKIKEDEDKLQMLVNRHQAIISTTQDGFWVTDIDGKIVEVNDTYCRMIGYSREELLTMAVSDLDAMDSKEEFIKHVKRIFSQGSDLFETNHRCKDGELINIEVSVSLTELSNGSFLCAFLRDISERHNLENQLRQSQKMEAIGTLTGGIAHDFNNILAIILGNIELTKIGIGDENTRLDNIQEATVRGKNLVNQLMTFSRHTASPKTAINPLPIFKEVSKFIRSTIPSSIEIKENLDHKNARIMADSTQLRHIMINLCSNAAQAMGEKGGLLEISLHNIAREQIKNEQLGRDSDNYLQLVIKDNGLGMSQEIQERIFEPFFTTQSKEKGAGLGLSVVHGAVQECNGAIELESKPEVGTTFKLYFPIVDYEAEQDEDIKQVNPKEKGGGYILFVDDEVGLVDVGKQMLTALGYKTDPYTDSQKALQMFKNNPEKYDVVITDQVMPNMTGTILAKEIHKSRPDIPIFLCTGYSEMITETNAAKSGFTKYFQKPVSLNDFATALKDYIIPQNAQNTKPQSAKAQIEDNPKSEDAKPIEENIKNSTDAIHVLLIDDDKFLTIIYEKALKKYDNVVVDIALDSQEALEIYKNNHEKYDLLIVDYMLPNTTGIDLAGMVKKIDSEQNIIIWSGHCDDELMQKAKDAGINQCLEKPFGYEDGVNIIKKILAPFMEQKSGNIIKSKKDLRILYVDDEEALLQTVELRLQVKGYRGFFCTVDPEVALNRFIEAPDAFDVVITDMNMPIMNGHELAKQILNIRPEIPIFLCSASFEYDDSMEVKSAKLLEIIPKPSSFEEIEAILEGAIPKSS
ncbi:MAG: response regulator [Magnetococcales bacterium]|nr:response regulator [Magnetococcales bacterium]